LSLTEAHTLLLHCRLLVLGTVLVTWSIMQLPPHKNTQDDSVRQYVENTWMTESKRWVPAFFGGMLHSMVSTTNGLERQHEELKHNYLADSSNGSLADLLSVPQSKRRYEQQNVRALDVVRCPHATLSAQQTPKVH